MLCMSGTLDRVSKAHAAGVLSPYASTGCFLRAFRGGGVMARGLAISKSHTIGANAAKGAIDAWHASSDKSSLTMTVPEKLSALTTSSNGALAAAGSLTGKVFVWEVSSGRLLRVLPHAHYQRVAVVRFTADGRHLVTGSMDSTVHVWSIAS